MRQSSAFFGCRITGLGAILAVWAGCFGAASASADEGPLSTEIRFGLFSPSYRWSNDLPPAAEYADRSLYFTPSVGARLYPKGSHGALIELDYRLDSDPDSLLFGEAFRVNFAVAHAGYAYRHTVAGPRLPDRRAWAFTPHVSFAAGAALSERTGGGVPSRSAVVGGRVGFDADLHIHRFFLGWSVSYEILAHTRGSIRYSNFFAFNAIPLFRIGGVIGRSVAPSRPQQRRRR